MTEVGMFLDVQLAAFTVSLPFPSVIYLYRSTNRAYITSYTTRLSTMISMSAWIRYDRTKATPVLIPEELLYRDGQKISPYTEVTVFVLTKRVPGLKIQPKRVKDHGLA
jgi:hypothetical protein